ncbi:branched-chain amino acid ABC transporter permease [Occultella glacieicola]|uniref:Branched-chain amino acid ABC transporter permease n=1 Tax=Occultella glacieicola TaxID=2518684 RepID=A0ABY2E407_9MICO|nr:branched-chain amino acid ABC transporter permease [Occultella glacieicola]
MLAGAALLVSWPSLAANPYLVSAGVVVLNYAVFASSWNIMGGLTGYISLGHAAYFGLGAYGTALLIQNFDIPSFGAWFLAGLLTLVIAIPVGWAALRVRGASFVIVTIALVLVLALIFQSLRGITGGSDGLIVPRPFPDLLRPEHHATFYYIYAGLLAVVLAVWFVIARSRFGAGLKAIREDEDKAESLGIPTTRYKGIAHALSAYFVALGGGLYALWFGDLDPIMQFSVLLSAEVVLMALLGGVRFLLGPLVGAIIVGTALEYFVLNFGETQLHLVATGILLAVVVLFLPDGVLAGLSELVARFRPQATSIREMTAEELQNQRVSEVRPGSGVDADPTSSERSEQELAPVERSPS